MIHTIRQLQLSFSYLTRVRTASRAPLLFVGVLLAVLLVSPIARVPGFAASPPGVVTGATQGPQPAAKPDDDDRSRFTTVVELRTEGGSRAEAAIIEYNKWLADGGRQVPLNAEFTQLSPAYQNKVKDLMVKMYKAAGTGKEAFSTVAMLIDKGLPDPSADFKKQYPETKISKELNVMMAKAREGWIEDLIVQVAKDKWKIARSDSGNVTSGIKSDIDQTFYVYERSPDGTKWIRNPDLDAVFIKEFEKAWQATHEVTLDHLDIASHQGKNRFPDPRAVEIPNYASVYRGTVEQLRNTKGAYTTYGAVLQQMQLRALQAIEEGNARAFQQYGPENGKTAGEWKKWAKFDRDEAIRTMFGEGMEPQLMHGLAFGAAMANLVEMQHYLHEDKFETKYHLRPWEDALYTELLVARGGGRTEKVEYTKLSPEEKARLNKEFLDKLFPVVSGADAMEVAKKRKLHELALEASATLRDLHKEDYAAIKKRLGMDLNGKTPLEKNQAVFGELAKAMRPEDFNPTATTPDAKAKHEQLIKDAVDHHRKLANEFVLRTAHHTSRDAFNLLIDADGAINLSKAQHLMSDRVRKTWANLRDGTNIALLYGFYDLGSVEGAKLRKMLIAEFPDHRFTLWQLYLQGNVQGFEGMMGAPDVYFKIYGKNLANITNTLNDRVQRHVLHDLGFQNVEKSRMVGIVLEHENLTWNWRKFAQEKVLNPANLDSVGNVMRKYFETKGDMTEVVKQVGDEILLNTPVIGQLESARRGGVQGWAMLGATIMFPAYAGPLLQAKLVYSLGEHIYAIHDILDVAPVQDNIIDAIYRGFAGPETISFGDPGKPPPTWSEAQEKELNSWYDKLREAEMIRSGAVGVSGAPLPGPMPDNPEWQLQREAEYHRRAINIMPHIEDLEARKLAFKQAQDGPWMGNVFGQHAQLTQKYFKNYLLKDIPPVIGFFSRGVVDLRVPYSPQDENRRTQLATMKQSHPELMARLQASQELEELEVRKARYAQGQAYLNRAKELEQRNQPEFMYRFRKDSLYAAFRQQHPNLTEEMITEHFLTTQIDNWIDKWIVDHRTAVIDELVAQGLLPESVKPAVLAPAGPLLGPTENVRPDPAQRQTQRPLPIDVQKLKARVKADMVRSRQYYLVYQEQEKNRQGAAIRNLGKAQTDYRMANATVWLQELGKGQPLPDAQMEELRLAMQEARAAMQYLVIPRQRPRLEATIYKVVGKEPPASDPTAKEKTPIAVEVATKLTVDPTIYYPYQNTGYRIDHQVLDKNAAAAAAVLPEAKEELRQLMTQYQEKLSHDNGMIVVVNAYAGGMPDLTQVPRETLARLTHVPTPNGILIAQKFGFLEMPAGPQPMEVWYELHKFPVPGIHEYEEISDFQPILKAQHHLNGTITGTVDHQIQVPGGVVESLKMDVAGKIDEASGRIDLDFKGRYVWDWSGAANLGKLGSYTDFHGKVSGWRGSNGWGNNTYSPMYTSKNVAPGEVTTTIGYFPAVTRESLNATEENWKQWPKTESKNATEWDLRIVGNRVWPTANYASIPKPMKKTWSSQYGDFILDQFGGYVEGLMRYTNKNIGVLRGDASNTSFNFHWFNSAESGYACMTSQDGGKSWSGQFYDGFCSNSKQPKGSLTLK